MHEMKRIAWNAVNKDVRGKPVVVTGIVGATHWDSSRVVVRLVEDDGSLGQEYRVLPSIVIAL